MQEIFYNVPFQFPEAVERGAFGAPTMFVGTEMFFGNDRLILLEALLKGKL